MDFSAKDMGSIGASLQDAWHYFDSILGGDTFAKEARSLKGRTYLYEEGRTSLLAAIERAVIASRTWSPEMQQPIHDVQGEFHELPYIDEIENEAALKEAATIAKSVAERTGAATGIDPTTGEPS